MPAFPRRAAAEAENLEAEECKLDPASLAGMLEHDVRIRNRLRYKEEGKLLRWMKNEKGKDIVGQMAMPIIAMNVRALTILARYWCPKAKKVAKSPSIHLVRREASKVCNIPQIQMLFDLGIKIVLNQDPAVNEFYEELFKHWCPKKKPVLIDLDKEENENEVDLSGLFSVKGEEEEEEEECGGNENRYAVMDPYFTQMMSDDSGPLPPLEPDPIETGEGEGVHAETGKHEDKVECDGLEKPLDRPSAVGVDGKDPATPHVELPEPMACIPTTPKDSVAKVPFTPEPEMQRLAMVKHEVVQPVAMDAVDTLAFDATQVAFDMKEAAAPIWVDETQPDGDGPGTVCRSLEADFSSDRKERLDAMEVPILQGTTREVDDPVSDQRVKDETKIDDQQVKAEMMAMEGEQAEAVKIEKSAEQVEDVKMEEHMQAEKKETGGEDMEAEDIGMGGGEVEDEKVTAVGEQVGDETMEKVNDEVGDDEEEMAEQLSPKDCGMEEEQEHEKVTGLDPLSKADKTQPDLETGEPPVVLRVEQWQQKPKAKAKAGPKGRPKAKAKNQAQGKGKKAITKNNSKRKAKGETVEILDSGEEGEVPEEEAAKPSCRKRVAKKARAKTAPNKEPTGSNEQPSKASDSKENKEPPIKYQPVTEEGKADIGAAFNWEDGKETEQAGEGNDNDAGPGLGEEEQVEEQAEDEQAEKQADVPTDKQQKSDLPSFARRPPPKTSPSRDRWFVIRDVFYEHLEPALKLYGFGNYKWEAW
eukprot:s607_g15.t1